MDVILENNTGVSVIRLVGRMNAVTVKPFEEQMMQCIGAGETRLLVDFTGCDYIDSSGLRVLLIGMKRLMASGGKMALFGLNPHITKVFTIAGLHVVFPLKETEHDAIAAVS